jgi:hypothetical protein
VHCALGLSLLRLLARPSVWAGSAWAGSPLPEAGELRPTAMGGDARSILASRRRGKVGKLTRSKLASRVAQFWGQKGGSPHRSWAVHGVGGRAGELDGDSVACRLRVVVDGP